MKKIKEILDKVIPDEISAFIILGVVTLAVVSTIAGYAVNQYSSIEVSSKMEALENLESNEVESITNLTSVENINSIDELQKLNEKEVKEAEEKKNENKKQQTASNQYYIKVNYGAQVVTIYSKDSNGKYTKPVKAMVCSTGTHTPTGGVYKTPAKIRWCHMIGDVYAQYCTQIVGDILFHSVPYLTKGDHSSLEYWAYDKLGTKASLGCVRLTCADAKWIYDNCKTGTQVEFYSSSNPGPLGKPSARKISNAPQSIRGWDPTDPVANNPWKKYLANGGKNEENTDKPTNSFKDNTVSNEVKNELNNIITNEIDNNAVEEPSTNIIETNVIEQPDQNTQIPINEVGANLISSNIVI